MLTLTTLFHVALVLKRLASFSTLAHLYGAYYRHLWLCFVSSCKKKEKKWWGRKTQLSHPIHITCIHTFPSSLMTLVASRLAEPIFRGETRKTARWGEDVLPPAALQRPSLLLTAPLWGLQSIGTCALVSWIK